MAERVGLGIDVGTSGLKAVAVDERGSTVAQSEREYPLHVPRPGWSEQDPNDWWEATKEALSELAGTLGNDYEPVALGLSGQMHGMVPLDGRGEVVRPAILWNDQRTGEAVEQIERAVSRDSLIERTGNPAITGFQLAKAVWLKQAEPDAFERTRRILFPKDFIGFRLTGEQYAEPTDASGSNAFNLHAKAWDGDILAALDLSTDLWPEVSPSQTVIGSIGQELGAQVGLPAGLDVVAGAGDNSAAAYGMGLSSRTPQLGSVSLGTSGVVFAPSARPKPDPHGRAHLFCHADGGYHLLGVTLAAAGSLRWFRDTFVPGRSFDQLAALTADSPPGSGGVTFMPYLSGERTPHMDPELRGAFHGLSLATGLPDMVRAVLEGVAFSLRDSLEVMRPLCSLERAFLLGGGARSPEWARIVADVLQLPLGATQLDQGPSYGAARMAMEISGAAPPKPDEGTAEWIEPAEFGPYEEAYRRYREYGPG